MKDEVEHLFKLIDAYTNRLHELELQQAVHGLSTPPQIKIEIQEIQSQIKELTSKIGATKDISKESKDRFKNILVVDDEQAIREEICAILEDAEESYNTFRAANGLEALRILYSEQIDLIVLDMMMPKMDGWELLRRLETMNIPVKVIVMSAGRDIRGIARTSFRAGVSNYLPKPFDMNVFLEAVKYSIEVDPTLDIASKDPSATLNILLSKTVDLLDKNTKLTAEISELNSELSRIEAEIKALKKPYNVMATAISRTIKDECGGSTVSRVRKLLSEFRKRLN